MMGKTYDVKAIKSYPIELVLKSFGIPVPARSCRVEQRIFSPFRDERTPSFYFNLHSNLWKDFGDMTGGDNIALVQRLAGCSFQEACRYICGLSGNQYPEKHFLSAEARFPHRDEPVYSIERIIDNIVDTRLLNYARGRMIPDNILDFHCCQVHLRNRRTGRISFQIGFPNNAGGWIVRSNLFKGCTSSACSFIGRGGGLVQAPTSGDVSVFEGFFNFLSWCFLRGEAMPGEDIVVLNSVGNLPEALPFVRSHARASLWLDNDDAGRKASCRLTEACREVAVRDCSAVYAGHNDVNDFIVCIGQETARNGMHFNEGHISLTP